MSSITIGFEKKKIIIHHKNSKHYDRAVLSIQRKYFLLCESCFWMASTLPLISSDRFNITELFKSCPMCNSNLDKFSIPNIE
ncbi:MAG: hypothetical protein ACTHJ2_00990 [Candidatus Nitrosocosmicus sp.]